VHADQSLARIASRCAFLAGVVLLASVPVYVFVEPPWRALVTRLACAVVVGATFLQARRALVERLGHASPLDEARRPSRLEPDVPHHFLDLMSDVRAALRSRRHFEDVLWPRLTAFTTRPLVRPPGRLGRGPSLASLREVVDAVERRP
jgi:hypothetical protein